MRCPGCGSDTTPALPRCTRCNTPLNTVPDDEATTSDAPPAPPWQTPAEPDPWAVPPREAGDWFQPREQTYREQTRHDPPAHESPAAPPPGPAPWSEPADWNQPPPAPPGEMTISLSEEPWNEPQIWQPPPPPRRSRAPYFLIAAGVLALAAVALAIVFWPAGPSDPGSAASTAGPQPSQEASPPEETSDTPTEASPSGDLKAQATAVDGLLSDMSSTRSQLGTVIESGCSSSGLQGIRSERKAQLAKARELEVGALENGTELRDALVRALQASVDSNQAYLDEAPGCPGEDNATIADANSRASAAKREFLGYWNPNAEKAGLGARSEGDI
ncbi:hypothetical protein [Actinomadura macrotermitis]|uniref:Uncharacterized protein n=1 Tax=Actinomadura macrotermitis TaxID=2585200 RepID=A0A7K0BTB6_9ACTN|nr:hypothetical protein [Actinomadura macrotermitis]MQY04430.1 hypothetical protein [Actinomadura macrotermitis]